MTGNDEGERSVRVVGLGLIAAGVLANEWFVGALVSRDGALDAWTLRTAVWLLDLVLVLGGILIATRRVRVPRFAPEALMLVISISVTLAALEVGARFWLRTFASPQQYADYALVAQLPPNALTVKPHHYMSYVLNPNFRRGKRSHNSMGYRDREFSVQKPPGTFRIVALGGSTTYTSAVEDNEQTFPTQLERVLRETHGYRAVEVINGGVGGYSSFESLIDLEFRVLDLQPDMVIVYHGTNDVHPRLVLPELYRGDNAGRRRYWELATPGLLDRLTLARILRRKFGRASQIGVEGVVDAPTALYMRYFRGPGDRSTLPDPMELLDRNPPVYFQRNLASMVVIARAAGVIPVLSTWAHSPYRNDYAATPHFERGFREGNDVVKAVASELGAPLFDFAAEMPTDTIYWADGRHVNEAGALLKAQLFAAFLDASGLIPKTP